MDFIIGYEVKLSGNHNCKGVPQGAFYDICDDLKGRYPKDFKWLGWRPNCRCYVVPIIKSEERFWEDEDKRGDDNEEITELPDNFKQWAVQNKDRIARAEQRGTLPYFVRDNRERVKQAIKQGDVMRSGDESIKLTPTPIKDISSIKEKMAKIAEENSTYFARGYKDIVPISAEGAGYMSTDADGLIKLNFATDKNGFNAGESLLSAFEKIKGNTPLSFNEEYSIEVLWHEILHNKSLNTTSLPPISSHLGFPRCVAETINQYVARSSYGDFLKGLGRESIHAKAIMDGGYSYNYTLQNVRKILKKAKIEETKFLVEAEKVLMKDYTGIDDKIGGILESLCEDKGKWEIRKVFGFIEFADFEAKLKILP